MTGDCVFVEFDDDGVLVGSGLPAGHCRGSSGTLRTGCPRRMYRFPRAERPAAMSRPQRVLSRSNRNEQRESGRASEVFQLCMPRGKPPPKRSLDGAPSRVGAIVRPGHPPQHIYLVTVN